jgi:Rne/Rng family ribonuclease
MQKGVDEPALAWCRAAPPPEDDWEECAADDDDDACEDDWDDDDDENGGGGGAIVGRRNGGRWADAWADGVGTSGSWDGGDDVAATATVDEYEEDVVRHRESATASAAVATAAEAEEEEEEEPKRRRRRRSRASIGASSSTSTSTSSSDESGASETTSPPPLAIAEAAYPEYSSSWLRAGGGPKNLGEHLGWTPWKEHVEREGRDGSLVGGNRVTEHWRPGMPVVVQVTRLGAGHKGPRVTARPTLPGRNVVLCPDGEGVYVSRKLMGPARAYVKAIGGAVAPDDCALIMRTEAAGVTKDVLEKDITSLADDWEEVRTRASSAVAAAGAQGRSPVPRRLLDAATVEQVLVRDLFGERIAALTVDTVAAYDNIVADLRRTGTSEENIARVKLHAGSEDVLSALGVADVAASATEERVSLRDDSLPGAHVVIQATEALTAVDVNAGRAAFINDSDNESVALRVNVAAATELAAQLRLRDIGGLVMVDFIDMSSRAHRKEVEAAFLRAAKSDRAQVTFLPISPLGVMEVARERLQGQGARGVVADEKGMPIDPDRPDGGPRRIRGSRPPPWKRGGRERGRGESGGESGGSNSSSSSSSASSSSSRGGMDDGRGGGNGGGFRRRDGWESYRAGAGAGGAASANEYGSNRSAGRSGARFTPRRVEWKSGNDREGGVASGGGRARGDWGNDASAGSGYYNARRAARGPSRGGTNRGRGGGGGDGRAGGPARDAGGWER